MDKRNDRPKESDSANAGNPQQFRLMDLFVLTTLVALVSAMVAPLLRALESDYRNRFFLVMGLHSIVAAATVVYYARKRKRLLGKSGSKIGSAYCGQYRWQHWPMVAAFSTVLFAALVQTFIAASMAYELASNGYMHGTISSIIDDLPVSHRVLHYLHYLSFLDYVIYAQIPIFSGYAFSLYRWQAYPFSIEFFENGIVKKGTSFTPWVRIEVRPSSVFADRIALVTRASQLAIEDLPSPSSVDSKDSIAGTIIMAQVKGELRERVFAVANAAHTTNQGNGA